MPLAPIFAAVESDIPLWLIAPFALLLLLIATAPLLPEGPKHLWEKFYHLVALGLGVAVAGWYLFRIPGGGEEIGSTLAEYVAFIVLVGSLFVVAGGIHLKVKGEATPMENVVFLACGALAANIIGTTGASMVLVRPWIRMNKIRISAFHIVFFIFMVSNVGGALTPIGDPPLFLGYLRGVPFFWLIDHVIVQWLVTIAAILAVFYVYDRRSYRHLPSRLKQEAEQPETWRFEGGVNVLLLLTIIGAVFLPERYFLREAVMVAVAAISYRVTPKVVHEENAFTFGPIKEVAWLFIGIFLTMMPALGYLEIHGPNFGFTHPLQYYFSGGALSAVLDNAPTYLNFLQLAQASAAAATPTAFVHAQGDPVGMVRTLLEIEPRYVVGVSLGAVFFGAMTYIGNGPNFMVRAIAHDAGVHCPGFFAYVLKYSVPILLPILALIGWLFL